MRNQGSKTLDQLESLSPKFLDNPYPFYHQLRIDDPVHWSEHLRSWIVTRYADVVSGLRDTRLSVRRENTYMGMLEEDVQRELERLRRFYTLWLMFSDPPDHTRVRSAVSAAFTPRMIENLEPYIQSAAENLLDSVQDTKQMELLETFASPLSVFVISKMLGVPLEDYGKIKAWSDNIVAFLGTGRPIPEKGRQAQESLFELVEYFEHLIAERQRDPADDLISALLVAREESGNLSDEELLATCANLLVDGHEPVTNLIGNGLLALLNSPDQLHKLKNEPSLVGGAVEELLRYDPPFQYSARRTTQGIRIGDKEIGAGQRVMFMLGAANRDPDYFHDPDKLDISRLKGRHLTFGFGPHYCLGATLGRVTGSIAINTLLRRMPTLRLSDQVLERRRSLGYRGLNALLIER